MCNKTQDFCIQRTGPLCTSEGPFAYYVQPKRSPNVRIKRRWFILLTHQKITMSRSEDGVVDAV